MTGRIVLVVSVLVLSSLALENCYVKSADRNELITSALPSEVLKSDDLPEAFDWRNKDGVNMLTLSRTYRNPAYCAACWAFAATTTFADRLKIMRNRAFPDIIPSPQVLINCNGEGGSCGGGDFLKAFEYMTKKGLPDEGCQLYDGKQHTCDDAHTCWNCNTEKCWAQQQYFSTFGVEYGSVKGEADMMKEMYARGPIACSLKDTSGFEEYTGGIITSSEAGASSMAVSVVGWGKENGKKYWIGRNNWGTHWGENGFFRIERGSNTLGIESDCGWIVPDKQQHHIVKDNKADYPPSYACKVQSVEFLNGGRVTQPLPHTYIKQNDLPRDFDWRNVNGTNWVTWDKNQHIPQYCGSCWAQASTSVVSDRFTIAMKGKSPSVNLSPQAMLNCACGSCGGGVPECVFVHLAEEGLPDNTCSEYVADDMDCKPLCKTCNATSCYEVKQFKKYKIGDYGTVSGAKKMKAEIYARGPISCYMTSTEKFAKYSGGVYEEKLWIKIPNHIIGIYGWGYDEAAQKDYWVGRNSWGTYWGEQGWFRIAQGDGSLGIENSCQWGVPIVDNE